MSQKIAIVGMEAVFGRIAGLDAFDRTVFDGLRHTEERSPEGGKKIRSGIRSQVKEGCLRVLDRSEPSGALARLRSAVEGAFQSALAGRVRAEWEDLALIVVCEGELSGLEKEPGRLIRDDSVFRAMQTAQDLLSDGGVKGVVVGAAQDTGAGAVFLKRADQAREDRDRIFAMIDAVAAGTAPPPDEGGPCAEEVARASATALRLAGAGPADIGYLEASGLGPEGQDADELRGLAEAYRAQGEGLTCALGSVRAAAGNGSAAPGLAPIIKAALCLYHRYIPAVPGWTGPADEGLWRLSPFYVPNESRPWFLDGEPGRRFAAVSDVRTGEAAHWVLAEEETERPRPNRYLALVAPYCFPLAGEDGADLAGRLEAMKREVEGSADLVRQAKANLEAYQRKARAPYALMIAGHTREDLLKEIAFMLKGIPAALEKGADLKTPKGSFFTPAPLGAEGKVAFVYPGVGSAYLGLGRNLFHLFPELYDRFSRVTPRMGEVLKAEELYPRTLRPLTEDEVWERELRLRKDIMTIAESGMGFFMLYTMILKDSFKVMPQCALGYSMGEPGMIASLGVWSEPGSLSDRFRRSPAFQEHLSGPLTAVRAYWNLSGNGDGAGTNLWDSFTLQASASHVREAIKGEERVYLTIINAPEEVVIAGAPEDCRRVIRKIGCKYYALGLDLAIHCGPTRLEYDRLLDIYTLPVLQGTGIKFYSSSCYKPIPLRSKAIAHSIAKAFSETVDFPRLVNQAYEDGARLFIELGSRKFCCNLIDRILKGRDHLAMAVNVKGTRDEVSLVRVLAQLVSHRVPVDLSPLF